MKNIVLIAALCATISLHGFHVTRKVCKEIPKVIPAALKEVLAAFEREDQARKVALEAQSAIIKSSDLEAVKKLRVDLLPNLIVAAADTRLVLQKHDRVVSVSSSYYDEKEKPEDYIKEFAQHAFCGTIPAEHFCYDEKYIAYKEFLRHLSKNPDLVKITQLK